MTFKLEATGDRAVKRILDENGAVVATARRFIPGIWLLCDMEGRPKSQATFGSAWALLTHINAGAAQ